MKILLLNIVLLLSDHLIAQPSWIKVEAGEHDRINTIVKISYNNNKKPKESYKLVNKQSGNKAAIQFTEDNAIFFVLPDTLLAGQTATYSVVKEKQATPATVRLLSDNGGIWAMANHKKILYYNSAVLQPPADSPAYYGRSGFVHPLYSPAGGLLTDDFPAGHAHQHGIMMAWSNTRFRGKNHDFWNQHLQTGNVRHDKVLRIGEGAVVSSIKTRLQHYIHTNEAVLHETWGIDIYPFSDYYVFDISSEQLNVTSDTLYLNKYLYGGAAFRGSKHWNEDDKANFTGKWDVATDSGFTVANGNGRRAAFVKVGGMVNNRWSAVAVIGHPSNFRYPQALRLHPTMPYWCFSPVVDEVFYIAPGQKYIAQYRYVVYDGKQNDAVVSRINNDMLYPPKISF